MEKHDAPPIKRRCVRGMDASADGSAAGGSAAVVVNDGANVTAIRDVVTTALDLNVKAVAATGPPQFVSIKSYLDGWFKLGPVVSPGRPRVLPIKQTEMSTALPKMSRNLDEPRSRFLTLQTGLRKLGLEKTWLGWSPVSSRRHRRRR